MTVLRGVIHNGQVVLPQPTDLPEGTEVQIVPMYFGSSVDDEQAVTAEEIARTLAAMECVKPFELTDSERAAIEADRRTHKEWEKSRFFEHADRLREIWD
jgi:hypothetical protein